MTRGPRGLITALTMDLDSKQPTPRSSSAPMQPSASSVDEELSRAANESLSIGPAVVKEPWYQFALPKKLHPGLYSTSLRDAPMDAAAGGSSVQTQQGGGVPGFPDFPEFWQGEEGGGREHNRRSNKQNNKHDSGTLDLGLLSLSRSKNKKKQKQQSTRQSARIKRQQRRLVRKAVNVPYGSAGTGRELKRKLRDQRRVRRIEMVVKLHETRRRKKAMGEICRGMASIKCK